MYKIHTTQSRIVCQIFKIMSSSAISNRSNNRRTSVDSAGYVIRPNFQNKFRPAIIKVKIHDVLLELLGDKDYDPGTVNELTQTVSDTIIKRLKESELERYKFIVNVVIGEQRGEGVKMTCRCFWDSDTDNYAHDMFMNNSLFCVASVFGIFFY